MSEVIEIPVGVWEHCQRDAETIAFLHRENARLKAEVERLTKAHSDALADFWAIHKGYFDIKAEVERLRKAGDKLEQEVIGCYFEQDDPADSESLRAWRAAKEGRPNE